MKTTLAVLTFVAVVGGALAGTARGAVLFADNYNTSADSSDVNFDYDQGRESGTVADIQYLQMTGPWGSGPGGTVADDGPLTSVTGGALALTSVNNDMPYVSPEHNFDEPLAAGQYLSIRFTIDPIVGGGGMSNTWAGITLGASDGAGRMTTPLASAPQLSLLLRDSDQFLLFDSDTSVGSGDYVAEPAEHTTYEIELRISGVNGDPDPWDGVNDMLFEAYVDGEAAPFASYTKAGGYADNYLTFVAANSTPEVTSTVDNLVVEIVPEPTTMAVLGLGGLFLLRRRRG